jgi:hypothetical protein
MSTITELQELTQKSQEQFLEAVRESQQAVVDAVGAWAQTVQGIASTVPPVPGAEQLPSAEAVIDNTFDLVEKLVAGQREFARNLLAAAAPASATATAKPAKPAK